MGAADDAPQWARVNRARWDELVDVHLASDMYDLTELRAGAGTLVPIDEAELPLIAPEGWHGLRVLHLQCHFGADTLTLAQRGATVVGLDFSMPAVKQARALAAELELSERARFVCANVYDARHALPEPEGFDVVYTTWGTIGWLPDITEWARIIAWFLKPGGRLYFADGHPSAFVFDEPQPGLPPPCSMAAPPSFRLHGSATSMTLRSTSTKKAIMPTRMLASRTRAPSSSCIPWVRRSPLSSMPGSPSTSCTSTTWFRGRCSRCSNRVRAASGGGPPQRGCRSA
ncbi:MAG: class I SAM-dependent methyltransferase [Microcella sp.]|nr:MAG: class I SAM-dependent methyltransferase [Microcella sp.]